MSSVNTDTALNARIAALEKENEYQAVQIKVLSNNKNRGERGEVLTKAHLFYLNQIREYGKLVDIFGQDAEEGVTLVDMVKRTDITDINHLADKAPSGSKSDCCVRMNKNKTVYFVSIKSYTGGNPSIINQTKRDAIVFQEGGKLHHCLPALDTIISEYNGERMAGGTEEMTISELESLAVPQTRERFVDVLKYFTFDGTGKRDNRYPANAMMTCRDGEIKFVRCVTDQEKRAYILSIIDTAIISLVHHGMPRNPKKITECMMRWVFKDVKSDGTVKQKGCFHVRIPPH